MKPFLLAVLLVLAGLGPARAQAAPGTHPVTSQADSVALLHQVFAKGRHSNRYGTFAFASLLALNASHLTRSEQHSSTLAFSTLGAGAAAAGLTISIIDWVRFSRRREALVTAQLEQGQLLPRYVRNSYAKLAAHQWQPGQP